MDRGALEDRSAGGKVIRGGALRTGGYLAGMVAAAVASVFLLRYLGVEDFGSYVVVMSIVAIVSGVTDVGLTVIGQREYATAPSEDARRRLLGNLVGIRLAITPLGVLVGTAFALVAGYGSTLVLGVLLAGAGLVLANTAATYTMPLTVGLRFGAVTLVEVSKQVALVIGIGAMVALGASLLPFFAIHIPAGLATLALSLWLAGRRLAIPPRFRLREWAPLFRETAPVAFALVVNVLYVRLLVVLASLLLTATETGLFATSYRVVEVFVAIPAFMVGSAFPVLAHAGANDRERLAYGLQRMGEVTLLVALGLSLVLAIAAEPVVEVLGGEEYADAAPVLAIQAFALVGAFLTQVWVFGLIAIRRQSALVAGNAVGLVTVLVLGLTLIPLLGASGAAIAAVAGELVLAGSFLFLLARAERDLMPNLGYVPKLLLAAALAGGLALALALPPVAGAALAGGAYALLAWLLRAIPAEVRQAFARGARQPSSSS